MLHCWHGRRSVISHRRPLVSSPTLAVPTPLPLPGDIPGTLPGMCASSLSPVLAEANAVDAALVAIKLGHVLQGGKNAEEAKQQTEEAPPHMRMQQSEWCS